MTLVQGFLVRIACPSPSIPHRFKRCFPTTTRTPWFSREKDLYTDSIVRTHHTGAHRPWSPVPTPTTSPATCRAMTHDASPRPPQCGWQDVKDFMRVRGAQRTAYMAPEFVVPRSASELRVGGVTVLRRAAIRATDTVLSLRRDWSTCGRRFLGAWRGWSVGHGPSCEGEKFFKCLDRPFRLRMSP